MNVKLHKARALWYPQKIYLQASKIYYKKLTSNVCYERENVSSLLWQLKTVLILRLIGKKLLEWNWLLNLFSRHNASAHTFRGTIERKEKTLQVVCCFATRLFSIPLLSSEYAGYGRTSIYFWSRNHISSVEKFSPALLRLDACSI